MNWRTLSWASLVSILFLATSAALLYPAPKKPKGKETPVEVTLPSAPDKIRDDAMGLSYPAKLLTGGAVRLDVDLDRAITFDFLTPASGSNNFSGVLMPWCITLDNSKGISRLRFWCKNSRVNGINDLPVFMHQGSGILPPVSISETDHHA